MNQELEKMNPVEQKPGFGWLKILGIVVVASVVATLISIWAIKVYVFPREFKPVTLSTHEEQVLDEKLDRFESVQRSRALHKSKTTSLAEKTLRPERYSEVGASREIVLTEKELNALLAKNTDLATRLAIDLSEDLASAKLLIPLDKDFPILGGETIRVNAGLELSYAEGQPIVVLRGISLWGVPLPNAWLGNLKNVDLVQEFGGDGGFWSAFADGIDVIKVDDGRLLVRLKE